MPDFITLSNNYDLSYAGYCCGDFNAAVTNRPTIQKPIKKVEYIDVLGRDGSLTIDHETYEDIEIPVEINFLAEPEQFREAERKITSWLLNGKDKKLYFTDDNAVFYLVKNVVVSEIQRNDKRIGVFTATFRCEPYMYYVVGETPLNNPTTINNQYALTSLPIYEITGNGLCTLTVNGNQFKIQTGGQMTAVIDTKRMVAYKKSTGVINNAMSSGKYSDLMLVTGNNTISITSGFTYKVYPNWRAL